MKKYITAKTYHINNQAMGYMREEFGKMLEQMMHDEFEVHVKEQEYLHGIQSDVKRVQVKKKPSKTKQQ